jgi:hypothetical protein
MVKYSNYMEERMTYDVEILKQLMWKIQNEHKLAFNELSKLPEGRLYREMIRGESYYYHIMGYGKERTRKGITKNTRLVYQLARKEYLMIKTKKQEDSMKLITDISSKMSLQSWLDAAETASKKFPAMPPEVFLLGDQYEPHPIHRSTMFLEGTIHRSQRGVLVRSKSELIIADMLESLGIPYQYEVDLPYDDYHLCPDFTVIRPRDGMVIFWEHFGMTHNEEYLSKMDIKLGRYRNMNIQPWNNLMISYDREDGSLDVGLIRALVDGWLR